MCCEIFFSKVIKNVIDSKVKKVVGEVPVFWLIEELIINETSFTFITSPIFYTNKR